MKIKLIYYASLREAIQKEKEVITIEKNTSLRNLYKILENRYKLLLDKETLRVAINDKYVCWETIIKENDQIVFIPPLSGG